jgi:hypothetical protein
VISTQTEEEQPPDGLGALAASRAFLSAARWKIWSSAFRKKKAREDQLNSLQP